MRVTKSFKKPKSSHHFWTFLLTWALPVRPANNRYLSSDFLKLTPHFTSFAFPAYFQYLPFWFFNLLVLTDLILPDLHHHISHTALLFHLPTTFPSSPRLCMLSYMRIFRFRFLIQTQCTLFPKGSLYSEEKSWHPHTLNPPHQTGFFLPVFPCPTGF